MVTLKEQSLIGFRLKEDWSRWSRNCILCGIIQLVEAAGKSPSVFSTEVTGSSPVTTPKIIFKDIHYIIKQFSVRKTNEVIIIES